MDKISIKRVTEQERQKMFNAEALRTMKKLVKAEGITSLELERLVSYYGKHIEQGFGCDCPGGDDVDIIAYVADESGRDCGTYYWLENN